MATCEQRNIPTISSLRSMQQLPAYFTINTAAWLLQSELIEFVIFQMVLVTLRPASVERI